MAALRRHREGRQGNANFIYIIKVSPIICQSIIKQRTSSGYAWFIFNVKVNLVMLLYEHMYSFDSNTNLDPAYEISGLDWLLFPLDPSLNT